MEELVEMSSSTLHVRYSPLLTEQQSLPVYYPRVLSYGFSISALSDEDDEDFELRFHAIPQSSAENLVSIGRRLLKKLKSWSVHELEGGYKKKHFHDRLVSETQFSQKYAELKTRYKHWVHKYPDEPKAEKYVFEDIAIAAYIICIWAQASSDKPPSFVDLGAGNGFLTYILTCEGFHGFGLDSQLRKTWSLFDNKCDLRQVSLQCDEASFPQADW